MQYKKDREEFLRLQDRELDGRENDAEYVARLEKMRDLELKKKQQFREDLRRQAEGDRRRRELQAEEDRNVEFPDDSELIRLQQEREQELRNNYRNDLQQAIQDKQKSAWPSTRLNRNSSTRE